MTVRFRLAAIVTAKNRKELTTTDTGTNSTYVIGKQCFSRPHTPRCIPLWLNPAEPRALIKANCAKIWTQNSPCLMNAILRNLRIWKDWNSLKVTDARAWVASLLGITSGVTASALTSSCQFVAFSPQGTISFLRRTLRPTNKVWFHALFEPTYWHFKLFSWNEVKFSNHKIYVWPHGVIRILELISWGMGKKILGTTGTF